uniref:Uncharacterized protein n=1 Tax=Gopherus agassizii TaxID=38772 RepID=A0A452H351_9SAUR
MSATLDLKSKEEKDAELDKRIEALRKKNQALIKRYQVRAGPVQAPGGWGFGLLPQKGLGSRTAPVRGAGSDPAPGHWLAGGGGEGMGYGSSPLGGAGVPWTCCALSLFPFPHQEWEERRRQNIEKMNEEMEKIAEYERNQRDGLQEKNPVRNFLDDPRRSGSFQEADRKEGSRRHVRNWGGPDFDKVKTGMEREKEWHGRRPGPKSGGPLDMTLSMTGRERAEYVRWKKEREQIDQERLARHRKPTGQWCREWDAEKTDTISPVPRLLTPCCPLLSDENKHPPRPPTFGEFLSEHRAERRRKGRGQPVTEEEEDEGHLSSSGEEEEEAEPLVESPKAPRALKVGRGPAPKLDMPPPGAHGGQGKTLSPFSPTEGYQPVSDWGEEMELNSPRGAPSLGHMLPVESLWA